MAGCRNCTSQSVPPVKSMPRLSPEKISEISPGMITTSEMVNQQLALASQMRHSIESLLALQDPSALRRWLEARACRCRTTSVLSDSPGGPARAGRCGDGDGREHADRDADEEGQCEPGDDRGCRCIGQTSRESTVVIIGRDVRIADRRPGVSESGLDRLGAAICPSVSSSFILAKIRTFASTAMPIERMNPAMPASVKRDREQLEDREDDRGVDEQREHREESRQSVVEDHEEGDDAKTDDAGQ